MNLNEAKTLATTAMHAHGLSGWTFRFNNSRKAAGVCYHSRRMIELSRILTEHATKDQVRQTVGHEIAHALAGHAAGHGPQWKAQMLSMGLRPDRCTAANETQAKALQQTAKYVLTCSVTGSVVSTLDRIVKSRKVNRGRATRNYSGHLCRCHRTMVLYNGKTWDEIV